jgi:ATP-dependent helicase/nuclease subunit A
VLTKSGDPRKPTAGILKADPDYAEHAAKLIECCQRLLQMRKAASSWSSSPQASAPAQTFALAYAEAKRAHGVVDFDDLIRWAERLLLTPGMGEWVRYKLDQSTDHILVDEAQDTNERQWNIVRAIALEYFAGEGASSRHRTIFTVGDYKQAIFGFQGTDPRSFDLARAYFDREARGIDEDFLDLSMDRSFRSSPPILAAVDRLIADLGHEALGLPRRPNPHESFHPRAPAPSPSGSLIRRKSRLPRRKRARRAGSATPPAATPGKLARQIRHWLDNPFHVEARAARSGPKTY